MDIEIPRDLAEAEQVPEDLDSNVVGPYMFPNPRRRRTAAFVYAAAGVVSIVAGVTALPVGMVAVGAAFFALAGYHLWTAFDVSVDEQEAFAIAGRSVQFPVGHASGAIRFEGVRARPVWNLLLYDAVDPPAHRALVQIDAMTGALRRDVYVEQITPDHPAG